jgi:hypothetical protein
LKPDTIIESGKDAEQGKTVMRDAKGRILPGHTANPSGRPRGRNWTATLAELAETKVRGGGGKTRAESILNAILDKAEQGDLTAASLIFDRIEGRSIARVDHTTGGEPLNASISFVDPINTIDITAPAELPSLRHRRAPRIPPAHNALSF